MNRFRFVDDHRDLYEVKRLCQVLKINRSSYYAWKSAAPARRQRLVITAYRNIPQTHQCRPIWNLPKGIHDHLIVLLT